MNLEEKWSALNEYCESCKSCQECALYGTGSCALPDGLHQKNEIIASYKKINPFEPVEEVPEPIEKVHDNVNHPSHYCREGAMECIDEMIVIFGKEAVKNFCACNAWKYRARAMYKNQEEDMRKSDWYLAKLQELMQL